LTEGSGVLTEFWTQWFTQERVLQEIYLPYGKVVGCSPVRVQTEQLGLSGTIGEEAREPERK
jgi:hypothetical protein